MQTHLISKWKPFAVAKNEIRPYALQDWIGDKGSFMQRLKHHGIIKPYVHVLRQLWQLPYPEEREILGITLRRLVLIREVLILSENKQWMFARTIFPYQSLTGKQRQLARLKKRSLGSVLFKDPKLIRSEFDVGLVDGNNWARRSIFTLRGKSLLLTELFLPDMITLCEK